MRPEKKKLTAPSRKSEGQANQSKIKMTLHENAHFVWIHNHSSLIEHWSPASSFKKQVLSLFLGKNSQLCYNHLMKYPPSLFSVCTSSHPIQNTTFPAVCHIIYFSHTANIFSIFWACHCITDRQPPGSQAFNKVATQNTKKINYFRNALNKEKKSYIFTANSLAGVN